MKWLGVKYKCACMQDEVEIQVPARTKRQNVVEFVQNTAALIHADHSLRNSLCTRNTMEYMKIPVLPNMPVGEADGEET